MLNKTRIVRNYLKSVLFCVAFFGFIFACQQKNSALDTTATSSNNLRHPEWSYNLSIYEVNLRQYSPDGTFAGFAQHLPRLKEMGVGVLWFMPIHPIGEKNRKGTLGSYYSVQDYLGVNPEFGSLAEFKELVTKIHELGMYVLIDWVANHTAWDNLLTSEHPEWYTRDINGNFLPPVPDWSDVIDLNYEDRGLWRYMIDAMKYWIEEADVDGFRCDVAEMVPLGFWDTAIKELRMIKPVFMLAEGAAPELHDSGFDMTYDWELFHLMNEVAAGHKFARDLDFRSSDKSRYPENAFRMRFTTNHDENSWNGTVFERLGGGAEVFSVLTATIPGMPLIYSGQETGLDKRLDFFEKDPIDWRQHEFTDIYTRLLSLKRDHPALWNGEQGGSFRRVETDRDSAVLAFFREKAGNEIFVVLNLTQGSTAVKFNEASAGEYVELFTDSSVSLGPGSVLTLEPWDYRVYIKQ